MHLSVVFIGGLLLAVAALGAGQPARPTVQHLRAHALRQYGRLMDVQQANNPPPGAGTSLAPQTSQGPQPTGTGGTQPPASTKAGAFGTGFDDQEAPQICRRGSQFEIASDRVASVCAGANYTVLRESTKYSDPQQADRDWHDFCTSFCVSTMAGFMQFTEFEPCLNEETNSLIAPILAMCQLRNGRYCGATLSMVSQTCENPRVARNQTACLATPGCTFSATEGCADNNATVILDRVCDPCVQDLLSSFGPESQEAQNLTFSCKKIGGKYCEAEVGHIVPQLKQQGIDWFTAQNVGDVCAPNAVHKYQCLLFYAGKDFAGRLQGAANAFPQCTQGAGPCLQELRNAQQAVFDDSRRLALMCDGHNTTQGVDYCLPKIKPLLSNECFQRATGTFKGTQGQGMTGPMMTSTAFATTTTLASTTTNAATSTAGPAATGAPADCNSACNTELTQLLNIGCCIGTIDEYLRVVFNFTAGDVPVVTEIRPGDLPAPLSAPANIRGLTICAGLSNISNQAQDMCVRLPAATPPRSLHLRVNATYILGSAEVRDRLMGVLFDDLASLLGVRDSDFVDGLLSRNQSIVFAGNQSGLTMSFKIHTRREDVQAFAAAEYDRLFAADQVVLPTTTTFLKQCKACVGRSGVADIVVTLRPPLQLPSTVRQDPCMTKTYFDMELALDRACGTSTALSALNFEEGRTANKTRQLIGEMCQGECVRKLQAAAKSQFAQCLPSDITAIASLLGVACSRDGPAYCGESLIIADQLQCEQWNETACRRRPQCVWNTKSSACFNDPSSDFLEPLCQSCMGRFVAAMAGEQGALAKLIVSTDALLCSRDGRALCRPLVSRELSTATDEGFSEPLTKELCNNATKRRCFKRVYAGQAALWRQDAEEAFSECAVKQNFEPEQVFTQCAPTLFNALSQTERFEDVTSKMCIVHPATRQPCLGFAEKFRNDSCVTEVMEQKQCSTSCDAHLKSVFDAMGCCAGVIHSIFGREANLQNDDLPNFGDEDDFAGGNGPTLPPQTTKAQPAPTTLPPITFGSGENASNVEEVVPTEGFLKLWAICPSLADIGTSATGLRKVCSKPREAAKVTRELPIGVAFDKMQGKTGRRMLGSLMRDLSNKLGLSHDDFPGTKFAEDRNRTVVTPKQNAAARRGFWAQQSAGTNAPSSAATVSITMSASKSEDGTAAAAQFDELVQSGSLTLPSTVKTAGNECKGCASASGGSTSLQSAATLTTLTSNDTTTAAPTAAPGAAPAHRIVVTFLLMVLTAAVLL